jgi:hypothetical protein
MNTSLFYIDVRLLNEMLVKEQGSNLRGIATKTCRTGLQIRGTSRHRQVR